VIRARLAVALIAALVVLGACGDDDPCGGALTCVQVDVESATADAIDALELDVLYGDLHATTTTRAPGRSSLPLSTALVLDIPGAPTLHVGVVAAGKLDGAVVGTGAATTAVGAGHHTDLVIELAPVEVCVDGARYCGGDKLVGEPDVLYRCNRGGVPTARGRCTLGCQRRTDKDDVCIGAPPCQDGGMYCGGDKLDGDPQTLYVCMNGAGTSPRECPGGCVVRPGSDDICQ
jgi:hypothetical protein